MFCSLHRWFFAEIPSSITAAILRDQVQYKFQFTTYSDVLKSNDSMYDASITFTCPLAPIWRIGPLCRREYDSVLIVVPCFYEYDP